MKDNNSKQLYFDFDEYIRQGEPEAVVTLLATLVSAIC